LDACADLAEEARDTRRTAPSATVQSVVVGGGLCFVLYILLGLAIPGSPSAFFSQPGNPLLNLMGDRFGSVAKVAVEVGVAWAFMSALIANMAGASRVSYGLARDNMLPWSRVWGMVSNRTRTPVGAILIAGGIGILFNYLSSGIASRAIPIVAGAGYMVYALIAAAVVIGCLRGKVPEPEPGLTNLGRWLLPAAVLGFTWCVAVILLLVVPSSGHTGAVYFLLAEAIGVVWLLTGLWVRSRRGACGPAYQPVGAVPASSAPTPATSASTV
jgi:amino acid transporter